jgi:hypothetical protein
MYIYVSLHLHIFTHVLSVKAAKPGVSSVADTQDRPFHHCEVKHAEEEVEEQELLEHLFRPDGVEIPTLATPVSPTPHAAHTPVLRDEGGEKRPVDHRKARDNANEVCVCVCVRLVVMYALAH